MLEESQKIQLAQTANGVYPWLISARRLIQSAHLLDKESNPNEIHTDVSNVARMCLGMAIECYLKALYLAKGNLLHDGKKQKKFGAHNLSQMAKDVGFDLVGKQDKVLHYLSMFVRVKGRYPVPLALDDMRVHPEDMTPIDKFSLKWEGDYDRICVEIVRALESTIKEERSAKNV